MRRIWAGLCFAGVMVVLSLGVASADGRAKVEVGIDGNISRTSRPTSTKYFYYYSSRDVKFLTASIPERVRVAFYLSPSTAIEVTPHIETISGNGGESLLMSLGFGFLGNYTDVTSGRSTYLMPSLGIDAFFGSGRPARQINIGAEYGVRILMSESFAGRFGLYIKHEFET